MLNSLEIKNFRALEDFRVEKLGRVNLIVGKNNSGKSTVLEALRIYAGNANQELMYRIAESRGELESQTIEFLTDLTLPLDSTNNQNLLPFQNLFTNQKFPESNSKGIFIGEMGERNQLNISPAIFLDIIDDKYFEEDKAIIKREVISLDEADQYSEVDARSATLVLKVSRAGKINYIRSTSPGLLAKIRSTDQQLILNSAFIPTHLIDLNSLAKEWDKIVLTEHEKIIQQALRIIVPDFSSLVFVQNEGRGRVAKIKVITSSRPLSLKGFGEGVQRILQLALNFPAAKGGFLLIDEFENGLHYSVQEKVWSLVFEMAQQLDIQVFATTHSWDCIQSFAKVARERQDVEGVLFRVGRSVRKKDEGKIIATVFDEEELYSITQNSIEVR